MQLNILNFMPVRMKLCQSKQADLLFSASLFYIFFYIFKRDYIPNILAVLTSQFLESEAPPPPPTSYGDRFLAWTLGGGGGSGVGYRQIDLDSLEIYTIPFADVNKCVVRKL